MSAKPDAYDRIYDLLKGRFQENAASAMVVFLASATRRFSVYVQGSSGSGKTTLVLGTLSLLPDEGVIIASRLSGAALFALEEAAVVVGDEMIRDGTFTRIRRMLISAGYAQAYLSTGAGDIRELRIEGPTAFIECVLADSTRDFQDSSRAVVVTMAESATQQTFHAMQTCRSLTPDGLREKREWDEVASLVQSDLQALNMESRPILDCDESAIVPPVVASHSARRIQQVLALAEAVARLRTVGNTSDVLRIGLADIDEALALLENSGAVDDHATLSHRARSFLSIFALLAGVTNSSDQLAPQSSWRGITIEDLLSELNRDGYHELARQIIHWNKRHPRSGRVTTPWTRSIIGPLLDTLEDNGLVVSTWKAGAKEWRMTEDGSVLIGCGSLRTFRLIRRQFNEYMLEHRRAVEP